MEPEDVVEASLTGLALGDVICSPALADRSSLTMNAKLATRSLGAVGGLSCRPATERSR